jgi:DNA-binding NarL/FixJ family response regulator
MASTFVNQQIDDPECILGTLPPPSLRGCCRCGQQFHSISRATCADCGKAKISRREKQIIELVSRAKANKEIAFELHLSEGTVKEYLNRIFRKLEVRSRTELAIRSLRPQETQSASASRVE